jgi:spore maturation protein CgeB
MISAQDQQERGTRIPYGRDVGLKVLYLGEMWLGSCARACLEALRELGCNTFVVDEATYIARGRSTRSRALARLVRREFIREYNDEIIRAAQRFQPDMLLGFKSPYVLPRTLIALRELGIPSYNYYPDRVKLAQGSPIAEALPEYDCLFDTKRKWDGDTAEWLHVRNRVFLPHGYDSELHRPIQMHSRSLQTYGCDVSFIGAWSTRKQPILERLVELQPGVDLRIWGDCWEKSPKLKQFVRGGAVFGEQYIRAIQASRINLGIMGITDEVKDETTTRTYEIPACGGFMLHERTPEVLELFEEGKEMACFDSPEELAEKIDYYLVHPEEREAIAAAGHRRCVPAYSYTERVRRIIDWHIEHHGIGFGASARQGTERKQAQSAAEGKR